MTDSRPDAERTVLRPRRFPGDAPASDAGSAEATAETPSPARAYDSPGDQATRTETLPASEGETKDTEDTSVTTKIAAAAATVAGAAKAQAAKLTAPSDPAARAARPARRTRKARLRISRVDPWSVMKTALLFGVAGCIILIVATYVVMSVIESTGLFPAINQAVKDVLSSPSDTNTFAIETYVNTKRVTGLAALIGAVDVVIFTALATVFSFLYNLSASMLGGLEITLAED